MVEYQTCDRRCRFSAQSVHCNFVQANWASYSQTGNSLLHIGCEWRPNVADYASTSVDWQETQCFYQCIGPSVHSSVTKLVNTISWKQVNDFHANWHKWSMEQGMKRSTAGSKRSEVKITEAKVIFGGLAEAPLLTRGVEYRYVLWLGWWCTRRPVYVGDV